MCKIIIFNSFNVWHVSIVVYVLNRGNHKYNSILVQYKPSVQYHTGAYVILNRRVHNINIEINLPDESIAGDNCIAETSHDAELLYTVKTDYYTYRRGLRFLLATSLRVVRAVGIFYCFWRAPPK